MGRETALQFAAAGVRVAGVARRERLLAELGGGIEPVVADLSTEEGCRSAVQQTEQRLGPVDILVHAAGIGSALEREIWLQDAALWAETMALNLDASFHLLRLTSAGMVERGFGRVVMVSSTAGLMGAARESAYDASKHGVVGLVRAAALDLIPHGVTCNAVLPGWVRSEMADRSAESEAQRRGISAADVWAERAESYAAGRVPTAAEVAATIVFLCSDAASGISGEAIKVALGDPW